LHNRPDIACEFPEEPAEGSGAALELLLESKEGAMNTPPLNETRFGFIGGGIIATVFIERLITSGAATSATILATDNRTARLSALKDEFGVGVSADNSDAARFADVLFVAVPPPAVGAVLAEVRSTLKPDALILSLAAAVPIQLMKNAAGERAIVRMIPNTPSQVGCGMNPYCFDPAIPDTQRAKALQVMSVFGQTLEVPEHLMNAEAALTAVGPTYVFPLLTALESEAIQQGMSENDAHFAVAQMLLGTARLMLDTGKEPDELKMMIGTRTIAEDLARSLFSEAYRKALDKVNETERKVLQMAASAASA
jgi:pyrroline-5-carboxylate reductase